MVVGNRQANTRVHLKPAAFGDHANRWWLPRVGVSRETQLSHVVTTLVRLVGQVENDEVPGEDVFFIRSCNELVLDDPIV